MKMISIYNIKPKFQNLLRPILKWLSNHNVTANQITISSIVLSLLIGLLFWNADKNNFLFLALPIGLLVRMALNALDGMMAREYNQQSKKGELFNEVGDVVSDLFIYFPLLKFEHDILYIIAGFLCLSVVNEFCGVMGKIVSQERRYEGPMGKSDRAFVLSMYGLISFFRSDLLNYSIWIFLTILILLIISTATRLFKALK